MRIKAEDDKSIAKIQNVPMRNGGICHVRRAVVKLSQVVKRPWKSKKFDICDGGREKEGREVRVRSQSRSLSFSFLGLLVLPFDMSLWVDQVCLSLPLFTFNLMILAVSPSFIRRSSLSP